MLPRAHQRHNAVAEVHGAAAARLHHYEVLAGHQRAAEPLWEARHQRQHRGARRQLLLQVGGPSPTLNVCVVPAYSEGNASLPGHVPLMFNSFLVDVYRARL